VGVISRILVIVSAIIGTSILGITSEYPEEILWDVNLPLVNLFSRWDAGYYAQIAISGYPSGNNPLAIHWAWFPLFPLIIGFIGKLFMGLLEPVESVVLAGFILNNILFFVNMLLFFKLTTFIFKNRKIALLSSIFFAFWPGSLFYSCVYSESLFMTLMLGAFYFLETEKEVKSAVLGFLAGLTRSSGLLIVIPFLYNFVKKRTDSSYYQMVFVSLPYLLFNLFGNVYTGVFPVRDVVYNQYWGYPSFFLIQLFEIASPYTILFFTEFCLVLVPFFYMFFSKDLLVSVFSLGIKCETRETKYFGLAFVQLILLLFVSIVANVHRYALSILPLYWVFTKICNEKPKLGVMSLALMISLLIIGTMLFSTWNWYW
jgi:Gpi18-like mannosyltransferase